MPLFGRPKTPKEVITTLRENLLILKAAQAGNRSERDRQRATAEVTRQLNLLKEQVTSSIAAANSASGNAGGGSNRGNNDNTIPSTSSLGSGLAMHDSGNDGYVGSSNVRAKETLVEVAAELQSQDTLYLLLSSMDKIDFECSKYVVDLFCLLLHRQVGESKPMLNYLCKNQDLLSLFLCGYEKHDHAIQYGSMLREASRHEELARLLLNSPDFYHLFKYVQGTTFDVSSDAFQSLRDLLTRHKGMVSKYLDSNYDKFFEHYHSMINSENYVTKRQALKLLSELLLERANYNTMKRYIDDVENLKLIMNLLKAQEKQIAFEAFHCFKVFVANPNKNRQIHSILFLNREKLVDFLSTFLPDRNEDQQFSDEKAYLIKTIREMKPYQSPNPVSTDCAPSANVQSGKKM